MKMFIKFDLMRDTAGQGLQENVIFIFAKSKNQAKICRFSRKFKKFLIVECVRLLANFGNIFANLITFLFSRKLLPSEKFVANIFTKFTKICAKFERNNFFPGASMLQVTTNTLQTFNEQKEKIQKIIIIPSYKLHSPKLQKSN